MAGRLPGLPLDQSPDLRVLPGACIYCGKPAGGLLQMADRLFLAPSRVQQVSEVRVQYAGLVLLATQVLTLTSQAGVAGATLAAAALFNPLRRRVQRQVDRRFNRARYNADNTVAAFAARLQDATDPDAVRSDLLGTVSQTLGPAHLSLWLADRPG